MSTFDFKVHPPYLVRSIRGLGRPQAGGRLLFAHLVLSVAPGIPTLPPRPGGQE